MPIGEEAQGITLWRHLEQADLGQGWKSEQPLQNFVEIRTGLGLAASCEAIDTSEVVRKLADEISRKQVEKGPAVAQGWYTGGLISHSPRVFSSTRTIWFMVPCCFFGAALEEGTFELRVRESVLEGWRRMQYQHQGLEHLYRIALTLDTSLLRYLLLDFCEPRQLLERGHDRFSQPANLSEQSIVPVFLAESAAIVAMAGAQEEEESRAQAEIDDSRVSHRLVRDDFDDL